MKPWFWLVIVAVLALVQFRLSNEGKTQEAVVGNAMWEGAKGALWFFFILSVLCMLSYNGLITR